MLVNKEQFKSGLLIILVLMCLVLIQSIWFDIPSKQIQMVSVEENQRRIQEIREEIVVPRRVIVSFDKGQSSSYFAVLKHEDMVEAWFGSKKWHYRNSCCFR